MHTATETKKIENIVTTDACGTGLGIALWQRRLKTNSFREPVFKRRRKKIFSRRIRAASGSVGIRTVQIPPLRETGPTILRPSSSGTASEKEQIK